MLLKHRLAPLALLLAAAGPILAEEPRPLPAAGARAAMESANQHLANAVAGELRASRSLQQFRVDVVAQNGLVELRGHVADANQRNEAIRLARTVPGVVQVVSRLEVANANAITRTQFDAAAEQAAPGGQVKPENTPPDLVPPPRKVDPDTQLQEPVPSFRAPVPAPTGTALPAPMPPYAWPGYAPYNNYSRVAYPQAYPCEAFPLIGPPYPFPKTPLGWRKVTLQWDDGHWWLQTHGGKRDWWVLRYW